MIKTDKTFEEVKEILKEENLTWAKAYEKLAEKEITPYRLESPPISNMREFKGCVAIYIKSGVMLIPYEKDEWEKNKLFIDKARMANEKDAELLEYSYQRMKEQLDVFETIRETQKLRRILK